ncbi:MAG: hypothetical protein ACFBSE_27385 [Prochloraceae cyanobacterium]
MTRLELVRFILAKRDNSRTSNRVVLIEIVVVGGTNLLRNIA